MSTGSPRRCAAWTKRPPWLRCRHSRGELTEIVIREVSAQLPEHARPQSARLARSLIATVHGHCTFALNGTFDLMGEADPLEMAVERVRESLAAASAA